MGTFKAAFRDVYEKGLMKYGFQKVKGNQPYYARCISDEIVHVITFRDYSNYTDDKEFAVLFGVATVYRKKIAFDEPSKYSTSWLSELSTICYKENYYPVHDHRAYEEMMPHWFKYDGEDENSMMDAIKKSFELTEKYAIPVLDKVTTLEDCINHFFKYCYGLVRLNMVILDGDDLRYLEDPHNEGLLSTVIYGQDRFEEYENIQLKGLEEDNDNELYYINTGLSGLTMEQHRNYKIEREEAHRKATNHFKELLKLEWQEKIRRELELRKKNNTEILRKAGFDI